MTYSGGTSVNGGTLELLDTSKSYANMTAAGGVTLEFNEANGNEVDITGGTYTGSGTLLKTGSGTLGPGNGYYPTSTVDLSPGGLIDVEQGELNASKTNQGNWLSNQGSLKIAGGATFNMEEQNIQVDAITGAGTLIASYWGSSNYTPTITLGVANGSGTFSGTLADGEFYGNYPIRLIKNGTGGEYFTGVSSYVGSTTVNDGTLSVVGMPGNGTYTIAAGGYARVQRRVLSLS